MSRYRGKGRDMDNMLCYGCSNRKCIGVEEDIKEHIRRQGPDGICKVM
jgi:hypothetical protein